LLRLEAAQERDDVDLQDVAGQQRHIRRDMRDQIGDQIPVDLDRKNRCARIGERQGQRPATGANLEKDVAWRGIDRGDDLSRPAGREKVLTEPFARPPERCQSRSPASVSFPRQ
jgi:hypothetical protein